MRAVRCTRWGLAGGFAGLALLASSARAGGDVGGEPPIKGPLTVLKANPRYFTDGSGRAVYLTGSHTWDVLQSWFKGMNSREGFNAEKPDSFSDYLDVLQKHRHNLIRLWVADTAWSPITKQPIEPQPYLRAGLGKAADGRPKFDLTRFNPAYFDSLRKHVVAARDRGMYVEVMLFNAWGTSRYRGAHHATWPYHPFHKDNNVNGIDGNPAGDGLGREYHALRVPAVTRLQEAYVRKVIDAVGDLDNVVYEISNESLAESKDWQYHMIDFIHKEEAGRPMRHPVLMGGDGEGLPNDVLFASPAEAVAPSDVDKRDYPAVTGSKPVFLDSDHNGSKRRDSAYVWKGFLRGYQPIVMDWWSGPEWDPIRKAMGNTRACADKMNLAAMTPRDDLASSTFCLADPGKEYLIYLPDGGSVTVDLTAAAGEMKSEWMHPVEGKITPGGTASGGGKRTLEAPFKGSAVLHLWKAE